jgi:16S rRNA (cytosine1402-N4)-methyltransferase
MGQRRRAEINATRMTLSWSLSMLILVRPAHEFVCGCRSFARASSLQRGVSSTAVHQQQAATAVARHSTAPTASTASAVTPGVGELPFGTQYHVPVLCMEVLQWLITDPNGVYIDGTLGGGGHSNALLDALAPGGRVIGLDRDPEALAAATQRLAFERDRGRFIAVRTNFAGAKEALQGCPLLADANSSSSSSSSKPKAAVQVDGMLLDLGVSSHQLDAAERGFSYSSDGPLDMRMGSSLESAADLCNELDQNSLRDIIYQLGEEKRSKRIAEAIIKARPLSTTAQLAAAVRSAVPYLEERKSLSRVFQALRIKVNGELEALESGLAQAQALVKPGGRIVVLSYHSLEDRRVKRMLASGNLRNNQLSKDLYGNKIAPWEALTRKPIVPSEAEIAANPRARSVKMRVAARTLHP